jgi:hypothetical protein
VSRGISCPSAEGLALVPAVSAATGEVAATGARVATGVQGLRGAMSSAAAPRVATRVQGQLFAGTLPATGAASAGKLRAWPEGAWVRRSSEACNALANAGTAKEASAGSAAWCKAEDTQAAETTCIPPRSSAC